MSKKYLQLALALCVTCAGLIISSNTAKAEEYEAGWNVSYNGSTITSDFKQADVNSQLSQMMPGDSITLSVDYKNDSTKTADYYMASDILSSLETNSQAAGGAYSYSISYNSGAGEQYIYNSETLGGDNATVEGLMQASTTNGNYFYVGRLDSGKSGKVIVKIALDGNSQTNSYMSQIAQLGIKFGVEDTGVTGRTVVYTTPGGTEIIYIKDGLVALAGPKTGDSILPLVACAVALLLGVMLVLYYFKMTKKEEEEA